MSEKKKKRSNSLRRILPSLFFPSKSKHKVEDDNPKIVKLDNFQRNISCNNTYTTVNSNADIYEPPPEENRIYENLKLYQDNYNVNKLAISEDFSTTSSSTTLVSESASMKLMPSKNHSTSTGSPYEPNQGLNHSNASPQVPRIINQESSINSDSVYYHDLENAKTFPIRNSRLENDGTEESEKYLQSVGAKIKCTSTQFTISPIKESAVRLNKQLRANLISIESNKKESLLEPFEKSNLRRSMQPQDSDKPYKYCAPTTPIVVGNKNKIPNMPKVHKSVSPYDHVRKSFSLAEEVSKYNSLNSYHNRNPYLSPDRTQNIEIDSRPATVGSSRRIIVSSKTSDDKMRKQSTRQNVEAFYWQKLQQMKAKEEQYLLGNSMTSNKNVPETTDANVTTKIYADRRSYSLPRESTLQYGKNRAQIETNKNVFFRGGMGRRTIETTSSDCETFPEPDVVLRNPEKIMQLLDERNRGYKIDFEKYNSTGVNMNGIIARNYRNAQTHKNGKYGNQPENKRKENCSTPELKGRLDESNIKKPVAPTRTSSWTSAAASAKYLLNARIKSNNGVAQPVRVIYSGSETSSEASEIQRIMQGTNLKGP